MTIEQLSAIQNRILSDIESLKKRIEETEEFSDPVEPDNAIGRVSRMESLLVRPEIKTCASCK